MRRYPQFTISPAILVALFAGWWLATDVLGAPAYVVPAPEQVLQRPDRGLSRAPWDTGGYWYHTGVTVWEALLGFAIGSALGAVLGFAISPLAAPRARAGTPISSASNRCPKSRWRR